MGHDAVYLEYVVRTLVEWNGASSGWKSNVCVTDTGVFSVSVPPTRACSPESIATWTSNNDTQRIGGGGGGGDNGGGNGGGDGRGDGRGGRDGGFGEGGGPAGGGGCFGGGGSGSGLNGGGMGFGSVGGGVVG